MTTLFLLILAGAPPTEAPPQGTGTSPMGPSDLVRHHPGTRMWIFYGDGRGRFETTLVAQGVDNHESRVADLDGDGDMDIVSKPYSLGAPGLEVWLNGGTGPRKARAAGP